MIIDGLRLHRDAVPALAKNANAGFALSVNGVIALADAGDAKASGTSSRNSCSVVQVVAKHTGISTRGITFTLTDDTISRVAYAKHAMIILAMRRHRDAIITFASQLTHVAPPLADRY
jgi:hypothetical protein